MFILYQKFNSQTKKKQSFKLLHSDFSNRKKNNWNFQNAQTF